MPFQVPGMARVPNSSWRIVFTVFMSGIWKAMDHDGQENLVISSPVSVGAGTLSFEQLRLDNARTARTCVLVETPPGSMACESLALFKAIGPKRVRGGIQSLGATPSPQDLSLRMAKAAID